MTEFLQQLMYLAITVLLPVSVKYLLDWVKAKTAETKYSQIVNIVADCVEETNQTYVDSLKSAGKFDAEAQQEAMSMSLSKAIAMLSNELTEYIKSSTDDVQGYLTTIIESYIKVNKEA